MVEIRVKGSVFLGVFQAIEIVGGWSAREAAVLALSGDDGDAVRTNTVLASGWYPVAWHRALLGGVIDRGGALGLREVIHCATRQNVGAVHRLLVRAFTPALLIKQASRVFSSLFEGEFLVDIPESHLARVQWRGCKGFDKTCWLAQMHSMEALVAMSGARIKRRTQLAGGGASDDSMTVEFSWHG